MIGKVFITGDKHGSFLPLTGLVEHNDITEADVLIIAGDAGYVWDDNYPYRVNTISMTFPGTVAFIDGNHENHEILNSLPVCEWNGGKAHEVGERVFHLMRGEVYKINGKTFFTFGGARSNDKDRRVEGESWWKEEDPTPEEFEYGREKLMANLDKIDYVITHETPEFARQFISRTKIIEPDYHLPKLFDNWYDIVSKGKMFKKWYFGHMHVDQSITPQLRALHNEILLIGDETSIKWA